MQLLAIPRMGFPTAADFDGFADLIINWPALLPGGIATFANYTSYTRGINGIMIDVSDLADPTAIAAREPSPAERPGAVAKAEDLSVLRLVETILQQSDAPPCVVMR